jgi:hypothetical protein
MKLASFQINEQDQLLTFERKLARENGWTPEFALRVVEEYRKFLFLCSSAGHPCSPSQQVDEAWHLHLTYTRSYWERLCGEVLPAPLHHEPTKGGAKESAKFDDWYERTLESYRRFFDSEPPLDIWPPTHLRFMKPQPERKADDFWMISKARTKRALSVLGVLGLATGAVGCTEETTSGLLGPMLFGGMGIAVLVGIAFSARKQDPKSRRLGDGRSDSSYGGGGCGVDTGTNDSGHSHGHGHGHGCGSHSGHGCGSGDSGGGDAGGGDGGSGCGSGCGGGCGGGD